MLTQAVPPPAHMLRKCCMYARLRCYEMDTGRACLGAGEEGWGGTGHSGVAALPEVEVVHGLGEREIARDLGRQVEQLHEHVEVALACMPRRRMTAGMQQQQQGWRTMLALRTRACVPC